MLTKSAFPHEVSGARSLARAAFAVVLLSSLPAAGAVRRPARPVPDFTATPIPAAMSGDADGLERAFVDVAERVGPAVVSIVATTTLVYRGSPWGDEGMDEFFRHFFEIPQTEQRQQVMSAGSGVIVSADGYVLTNAHVIGQARNISVHLLGKKEYRAKIVGKDEDTDLAVLKIKADAPLTAAGLGDSDRIHVGQWAIAIGNPFALENTVTVGVVSAKGRQLDSGTGGRSARYTSYIQTDASINRGNSGGPLIDIHGQVIGINTMIYSPSGGSVGIGFAIPVNLAKRVMEGLIKEGKIVRPQLGIAYGPIRPEVAKMLGLPAGQGMEVSGVLKGTAAERAGLKPGDIILLVDGKPLKDREELRAIVLAHRVGDTVSLDVQRKGKRMKLDIVLKEEQAPAEEARSGGKGGKAPAEASAAWMGMTVQELTEEMAQHLEARTDEGLVVTEVSPDSPASLSGLEHGDIIREIEQEAVASLQDFKAAMTRFKDKDSVLFLVERQGSTMYLVVQKNAKPEPEQ